VVSNISYFHPQKIGEDDESNLTITFFKGVGSTTKNGIVTVRNGVITLHINNPYKL